MSDRAPTFLWGGRPVYRCSKCPYERVENLADVLVHEADTHGLVVRETEIIGLDGAPLQIVEEQPKEEPPRVATERTRQSRRRRK